MFSSNIMTLLRLSILFSLGLASVACTTTSSNAQYPIPQQGAETSVLKEQIVEQPAFLQQNFKNIDSAYLDLIWQAEQNAHPAGRKLLTQARQMTLFNREIIRGGCWDYVNAVFNRAGFAKDSRYIVHQGTYRRGPYAHRDEIQAGDWLYYINYSYRNIEHSGMFIAWVDKERHQALMLSYAGQHRREPARYKVYDLRSVYQITRAM